MIIYKATNQIDGKCYVGLTTNPLRIRKSSHKSEAEAGRSTPFHKALMENYDSFTWEILEECKTWEELQEKERYWIEKYKAADRKYGYNTHSHKFSSRYKKVISRKLMRVKIDDINAYYQMGFLAYLLGMQPNELLEEGIQYVLDKNGIKYDEA